MNAAYMDQIWIWPIFCLPLVFFTKKVYRSTRLLLDRLHRDALAASAHSRKQRAYTSGTRLHAWDLPVPSSIMRLVPLSSRIRHLGRYVYQVPVPKGIVMCNICERVLLGMIGALTYEYHGVACTVPESVCIARATVVSSISIQCSTILLDRKCWSRFALTPSRISRILACIRCY